MDNLADAALKISQLRHEIRHVRTSDFHHPAAKGVLGDIDKLFERLFIKTKELSGANLDVIHEHCMKVNRSVRHFHPVIGFILRSTNPRNSFEIYDPLLRLARRLIGELTVLVLSSEWDYLPFATPSVFGNLATCTFVGLPVIEAANALIIPLACHELGHAVWRANKLDSQITQSRLDALGDVLMARQDRLSRYMKIDSKDYILQRLRLEDEDWATIVNPSSRTICEEIFCDMLGVRLFGMSYLYAFAYLTAPTFGETDLRDYPALDARARFMVDAINEFGIAEVGRPEWPYFRQFKDKFMEEPTPKLDEYDEILLKATHEACEVLVPDLRRLASVACNPRGASPRPIPLPTFAAARRAQIKFERGLPTTGHLPDLVNGGWLGYLSSGFGDAKSSLVKSKFRVINELIFKSLDVTEYERRREDASQI